MTYFVGLDLGQRQDHAAIAVVERREIWRAYLPPKVDGYLVRYVERVPLGTSYPDVVEKVRRIVKHPQMEGVCCLALDGTGAVPVVDMVRAARLGCELNPVTITGGARAHRYCTARGSAWSVPKEDLIVGLQVLLERGELRMAHGLQELGALMRELMDMKLCYGVKGRVRYGAEGEGEHDDLVIALALACWRAQWSTNGYGSRRLPGI